jgi:Uma2 family endonuclease
MSIQTRHVYDPMYPDSDGEPMAENQEQYDWITRLCGHLTVLFVKDGLGVVAADNFIYPVQGQPTIVQAPDVYVALGRPTDPPRLSYRVWEEGGVFPQVIFEVLSPSNTPAIMQRRRTFYETYGALEYYEIDPETRTVLAMIREGDRWVEVPEIEGFVSPLLGIQFVWDESGHLGVIGQDGVLFQTYPELRFQYEETVEELEETQERLQQAESRIRAEGTARRREELRAEREAERADAERAKAEREAERAKTASAQAESERLAKEKLAAKLRELGVDPDQL